MAVVTISAIRSPFSWSDERATRSRTMASSSGLPMSYERMGEANLSGTGGEGDRHAEKGGPEGPRRTTAFHTVS